MGVNKGLNYNNEAPRTEDLSQYVFLPKMMQRAQAAHYNALEMFPYYAVSVLMARMQKVRPTVLIPLCGRYLVLRTVYTFLYILGVNKLVALMRTIVWATMFGLVSKIAMAGL